MVCEETQIPLISHCMHVGVKGSHAFQILPYWKDTCSRSHGDFAHNWANECKAIVDMVTGVAFEGPRLSAVIATDPR